MQRSQKRVRGILAAGLIAAILLPGAASAAQQSAARKVGRGRLSIRE